MLSYTPDQTSSLYELGRLYFEMGYFVPAERMFAGLAAIDPAFVPARIGLGAVKLERGLFQEASTQFRIAVQAGGANGLLAKLGLVAAFLGAQDMVRARSLLGEVVKELNERRDVDAEVRTLAEAFVVRVG